MNADSRLWATAQKIFNTRVKLMLAGGQDLLEEKTEKVNTSLVDDENEEESDNDDDEEDLEDWLQLLDQMDSKRKLSKDDNNKDGDEILDTLDIDSEGFRNLPQNTQQGILMAMRERLYQQLHSRSIHKDCHSESFSARQIEALVKRRKILAALEKAKQPHHLLEDVRMRKGGQRIASQAGKEYILVKDEETAGWKFEPISITTEHIRKKLTDRKVVDAEDDNFEALFFAEDSKRTSVDKVDGGHVKNVENPSLIAEDFDRNEKNAESALDSKEGGIPDVSSIDKNALFGTRKMEFSNESSIVDYSEPLVVAEKQFTNQLEPLILQKQLPIQIDDDNDEINETTNNLYYDQKAIQENIAKIISIEPEKPLDLPVTLDNEDSPDKDLDKDNRESFSVQKNEALIEDLQAELAQIRKEASQEASKAMIALQGELIADIKAVLACCGIPWVQAPFEAEAQCAWLARQGLVDGIVTDDSDVLLFGPLPSTPIYRHFHTGNDNNRKRSGGSQFGTVSFSLEGIRRDVGLDRWQLVSLALLLGGDYGAGVAGLGPVRSNAIIRGLATVNMEAVDRELIADFINRLIEISASPDKKLSSIPPSLAARLAKLNLPGSLDGWERIVQAYYEPNVDENFQTFQWRPADLPRLSQMLVIDFHLSKERVQEMLHPLVNQKNILLK